MNTYGYVGGNPLGYTDPLGLLGFAGTGAGSGMLGAGGALNGASTAYGTPGNKVIALGLDNLIDHAVSIWTPNLYNGWDDKFPGLDLPPGVGDLIDPWKDTNASTEANSCPTNSGPPLDPRERCFNGVALSHSECMQSGTNPVACHAKRVLGLLLCSAKSSD